MKATFYLCGRLSVKFNFMVIETSEQHVNALEAVKKWWMREDYSLESMSEIDGVIRAIEAYSGMPLPARSFIMAKVFFKQSA